MNVDTKPFSTAILFLVFNRAHTTAQVFESIRKIKPTKLYVAADGPRSNKEGELEKCLEVRRIATQVDWDCEVVTLFRDENLGCGLAVSSAITWFFEHESEGIILEDDTLPCQDFFPYCAELLARYRDDQRVMQIGGVNLLPPAHRKNAYSYYFSNHNNIWGWGTWKRAWDLYDFEMKQYNGVHSMNHLRDHFASIHEEDYFSYVFERTSILPNITWDYQWEFVRRMNSGLTIVPSSNLVINLGFGEDATHTAGHGGPASELKLEKMGFPMKHPDVMLVDAKADRAFFIHCLTTLRSRVRTYIKRMLPPRIREKLQKAAIKRYVDDYKGRTNGSSASQVKVTQQHAKLGILSLGKFLYAANIFDVDIDLACLLIMGASM